MWKFFLKLIINRLQANDNDNIMIIWHNFGFVDMLYKEDYYLIIL